MSFENIMDAIENRLLGKLPAEVVKFVHLLLIITLFGLVLSIAVALIGLGAIICYNIDVSEPLTLLYLPLGSIIAFAGVACVAVAQAWLD